MFWVIAQHSLIPVDRVRVINMVDIIPKDTSDSGYKDTDDFSSRSSSMMIIVEQRIIQRLKDRGLQVRAFELKKEGNLGLTLPAVRCNIEDGTFKKIGQTSFKQIIDIRISVFFKNFGTEESRRKGIYPILAGVIDILTLQDIGLKIDEIEPVSFRRIFHEKYEEAGMIVFQIMFKTGFMIDKVDDDVAGELITIGLNYLLKPGDDEIDAQDEITLV